MTDHETSREEQMAPGWLLSLGSRRRLDLTQGETNSPRVSKPQHKAPAMGDRSPKSNKKLASQKQHKTDTENRKKAKAIADKQGAAPSADGRKKK